MLIRSRQGYGRHETPLAARVRIVTTADGLITHNPAMAANRPYGRFRCSRIMCITGSHTNVWLAPIADIGTQSWNVRFVPIAEKRWPMPKPAKVDNSRFAERLLKQRK